MREPLVFLPGMMCDARLFFPQIARFSSERPVIVMPLIEHDSVEALAEQILADAPPSFALAGLSMGGIVAMEVVRQSPQRVTRLALMGTSPLADLDKHKELRNVQIANVRAGRLRTVIRDEMKPNYLVDGPRKPEILKLCMSMADVLGADTFITQSRSLQRRRNQTDTLRSIKVPTLILCGEGDVLCPLERHELMRNLVSGSNLVVIPEAGHLPTLEQPELTNNALAQWLQDF